MVKSSRIKDKELVRHLTELVRLLADLRLAFRDVF
jgi:hypothetical protein